MCYAIPGKIVEIKDDTAVVDYDGIRKNANISLVDNVQVGEFVLVHAGFAIEKIDNIKAEESVNMVKRFFKKENG